jgi:hypothetical protein
MHQWWFEIMHGGYALANVDKYLEYFCFCETLPESAVHHVDNPSSLTELHKNENLVGVVAEFIP